MNYTEDFVWCSNQKSSADNFMCRNQQQTSLPLIGPCGLPRHELGINPFMVGAIYAENSRICKSDIEDCSKCPLNPDIKTLNHCEIEMRFKGM